MLQKGKHSFFFNNDYMNDNESWASTNKDSNVTTSIKGNSSYNFFRDKNIFQRKHGNDNNFIEKEIKRNMKIINIPSFIEKIPDKANKNENNKILSKMNNNYSPKSFSNFNNYNKNNNKKNSLLNQTVNILNLKKANFKQNMPKFIFQNYLTFKPNRKEQKEPIKKKFKEKINKSQSIITNKKKYFPIKVVIKNNHKNKTKRISTNEKIDFNEEKEKISLLKNQYINNIKNTHILFHDIKNKMSNITEFQKNILELNKKSLKYLTLSKEDNLKKYKDENKEKLNVYKLKKNQITKRPFSCNDKVETKKKKKKIVKKKVLSEDVVNRARKRENFIKEKINNIKKYDNINSICYKSLRFCNEILKENQEKKLNFYIYLKQKVNNNKVKNKYYSENITINMEL